MSAVYPQAETDPISTGALAAFRLEHNTTIGIASAGVDGISFAYTSVWGIDPDGDPYFDPSGVPDSERAVLFVNNAGDLVLAAI